MNIRKFITFALEHLLLFLLPAAKSAAQQVPNKEEIMVRSDEKELHPFVLHSSMPAITHLY